MDHFFAPQTKEFIAKSREMAINMGYDYISTIHFFLADCENESAFSILNFAFKKPQEYTSFKNSYLKDKIEYLNFLTESIPLTKEAEIAIRASILEQKNSGQNNTYPWHILMSAIKDKNSLLSECFKNYHDVDSKLLKYYSDLGAFEFRDNYTNIVEETIKFNNSFLGKILRFFKRRN